MSLLELDKEDIFYENVLANLKIAEPQLMITNYFDTIQTDLTSSYNEILKTISCLKDKYLLKELNSKLKKLNSAINDFKKELTNNLKKNSEAFMKRYEKFLLNLKHACFDHCVTYELDSENVTSLNNELLDEFHSLKKDLFKGKTFFIVKWNSNEIFYLGSTVLIEIYFDEQVVEVLKYLLQHDEPLDLKLVIKAFKKFEKKLVPEPRIESKYALSSLCFKVFKLTNELKSRLAKSNQVVIRADIFDEVFIEMNLSEKRIESIKSNAFEDHNCLKKIKLNKNDINELEPDCFNHLTRLETLYMCNNKLTAIKGLEFERLAFLKHLNLKRNQIDSIESNSFVNLAHLEFLDLSFNDMKCVTAKIFAGLISLKNLNLESNQISYIEKDSFIALSNMFILNLESNLLKQFDKSLFSGLKSLITLSLSSNQLETDTIVNLERSIALNKPLDHKSVSNSNYFYLIMIGLNVLKITDRIFSTVKYPLDNLVSIDLSYNQLKLIDENFFRGLFNLTAVNLSCNQIERIAATAFKGIKLVKLNLRQNFIEKVDNFPLFNIQKKADIDLTHNFMSRDQINLFALQALKFKLNLCLDPV